MSSRTVPVTFTFRRQGLSPPVFVVGSFSSPPWQPVEMDNATDENGDFNFSKEVMVDESTEIQYKYRIGSDEWILDPNADTFTEDGGNVNSFVRAPVFQEAEEKTVAPESHDTESRDAIADQASEAPTNDETPTADSEISSSDTPTEDTEDTEASTLNVENNDTKPSSLTPIEEVAQTAAEVADSAAELDGNGSDADGGDDALMLSHERFASEDSLKAGQQEWSELQNDELDHSDTANELAVDYDDPRLERFPSDRGSIIATMRRLSTNVDPDSTLVGTPPLSPVIIEQQAVMSDSSLPLDPMDTDNTNLEKHELEETGRSLEAARSSRMSLQSITEGEEVPSGNFDHPAQYVGPVEPHDLSLASADSSNEDEGISMGDSPARNKKTVDNTRSLADTDVVDNVAVGEEQKSTIPIPPQAEEPHDKSDLQKPANGERSQPPAASYSAPTKEKGQWLRNFLRTIFVDWISGIFGWLVGRDRSEVKLDIGASSRIGAVVILGAGISLWALQDRLGLANSFGKST